MRKVFCGMVTLLKWVIISAAILLKTARLTGAIWAIPG
jgi:hypothetical protein